MEQHRENYERKQVNYQDDYSRKDFRDDQSQYSRYSRIEPRRQYRDDQSRNDQYNRQDQRPKDRPTQQETNHQDRQDQHQARQQDPRREERQYREKQIKDEQLQKEQQKDQQSRHRERQYVQQESRNQDHQYHKEQKKNQDHPQNHEPQRREEKQMANKIPLMDLERIRNRDPPENPARIPYIDRGEINEQVEVAQKIKNKLNQRTSLQGSEDPQPAVKERIQSKTSLMGSEETKVVYLAKKKKELPTSLYGSEPLAEKKQIQSDTYNSDIFHRENLEMKPILKKNNQQQSKAFDWINNVDEQEKRSYKKVDNIFNNVENTDQWNRDFDLQEKKDREIKKEKNKQYQQQQRELAQEIYEEFKNRTKGLDHKAFQRAKEEFYQNDLAKYLNGIYKRDPIHLENSEELEVKLMNQKKPPPQEYINYIQKNNSNFAFFQQKKRDEQNFNKYLNHTEDNIPLMQQKQKTEFSDHMRDYNNGADYQMFQNKKKTEMAKIIADQSKNEREVFDVKKKRCPEYENKYLNSEVKTEQVFNKQKENLALQESKNSPLHFTKMDTLQVFFIFQKQLEESKKPKSEFNYQTNKYDEIKTRAQKINDYINDTSSYYSGKYSIKAPSNISSASYLSKQSRSVIYDSYKLPGYTDLTKKNIRDDISEGRQKRGLDSYIQRK